MIDVKLRIPNDNRPLLYRLVRQQSCARTADYFALQQAGLTHVCARAFAPAQRRLPGFPSSKAVSSQDVLLTDKLVFFYITK